MFGSPTPTKQTRCPTSSRAAATIIISDLLKGWSVIGRLRRRSVRGRSPPAGPTSEGALYPLPSVPPAGPVDAATPGRRPCRSSRALVAPPGGPSQSVGTPGVRIGGRDWPPTPAGTPDVPDDAGTADSGRS